MYQNQALQSQIVRRSASEKHGLQSRLLGQQNQEHGMQLSLLLVMYRELHHQLLMS